MVAFPSEKKQCLPADRSPFIEMSFYLSCLTLPWLCSGQVLELLCQILQTDSLSLVQQWLLLAGQRGKTRPWSRHPAWSHRGDTQYLQRGTTLNNSSGKKQCLDEKLLYKIQCTEQYATGLTTVCVCDSVRSVVESHQGYLILWSLDREGHGDGVDSAGHGGQ